MDRLNSGYELAFQTRAQAESALSVVEAALAEFELVINPTKTQILELPEPFQASWPHDILTFTLREDNPREMTNDLVALFSKAAHIAKTQLRVAQGGALKYALQRCRGIDLQAASWRTFQHLVWGAVSAEPTTIPTVLDLLQVKSEELDEPIDNEQARRTLEGMITVHAPVRDSSEVAWAIWAATSLEVNLSEHAATTVSRVEDDIVALLAMHGDDMGTFAEGGLDRSTWAALIDEKTALSGPHWLLAYEAVEQGWLADPDDRIARDQFFGQLSDAVVRFYDIDASWAPFSGPSGPLPGSVYVDDYE